MGRNTWLGLLAVLILACGRSDRTADHKFFITKEDGVEVSHDVKETVERFRQEGLLEADSPAGG